MQVVEVQRAHGRMVAVLQRLQDISSCCSRCGGPAHAEQNHYLRIYMGHLRQKLERDPAQPKHLLTKTAVGYRLVT